MFASNSPSLLPLSPGCMRVPLHMHASQKGLGSQRQLPRPESIIISQLDNLKSNEVGQLRMDGLRSSFLTHLDDFQSAFTNQLKLSNFRLNGLQAKQNSG